MPYSFGPRQTCNIFPLLLTVETVTIPPKKGFYYDTED